MINCIKFIRKHSLIVILAWIARRILVLLHKDKYVKANLILSLESSYGFTFVRAVGISPLLYRKRPTTTNLGLEGDWLIIVSSNEDSMRVIFEKRRREVLNIINIKGFEHHNEELVSKEQASILLPNTKLLSYGLSNISPSWYFPKSMFTNNERKFYIVL